MYLACRRGAWGLPPLYLLISLMIFVLILTKQVKDLYEKTQKNKRINSYNEFLNEVSESMSDLEANLNKSSVVVRELASLMGEHKTRPRPLT